MSFFAVQCFSSSTGIRLADIPKKQGKKSSLSAAFKVGMFGNRASQQNYSTRTVGAKVNSMVLPPEHVLLRLVAKVVNPHKSWNSKTGICNWFGVKCDAQGVVKEIRWWAQGLHGELNLRHLPHTLSSFCVEVNKFSGPALLHVLPITLEYFNLNQNKFFGALDLASLPRALLSTNLSSNQFTGEVCLAMLPTHLERLSLDSNSLSGSIDLTQLPTSIKALSLSMNKFSGDLCFSKLPRTLESLDISGNAFSGSPDLTRLPEINYYNLSDNVAMQGEIEILPRGMFVRNTQIKVLGHDAQASGYIQETRIDAESRALADQRY